MISDFKQLTVSLSFQFLNINVVHEIIFLNLYETNYVIRIEALLENEAARKVFRIGIKSTIKINRTNK